MTFKKWYTIEDAKLVLNLTTQRLRGLMERGLFPILQTVDSPGVFVDPMGLQNYRWGQVYSFGEILQIYAWLQMDMKRNGARFKHIHLSFFEQDVRNFLEEIGMFDPITALRDLIISFHSKEMRIFEHRPADHFFVKRLRKLEEQAEEGVWHLHFAKLFDRIDKVFPEYIYNEKPQRIGCPYCQRPITENFLKSLNFFQDRLHNDILCPQCGGGLLVDAEQEIVQERITIHSIQAPLI